MRRSAYIFSFILLALAIGLLVWYFCRSRSSAIAAIPADASAVAQIDMKELKRTAGLDLGSFLGRQGLSDPSLAGINIAEPAYGFISGQGHFGLLLSVESKGRIKKAFHTQGIEVENQRGILWASLRGWVAAFDSDQMLVMGPVSDAEVGALRSQMALLMKQKETATRMLDELKSQPGTLKLLSRMDVMPKSFTQALRKWLPAGIDLGRVMVSVSLQARKSSFILDAELLSEDPKVLQAFEQADSLWRPIQGDLIGRGPSSSVLWATAGMRGDRLLNLLRQNPTLRTRLIALNMCVDADMMLRSIDGDVSLAVPSIPLKFKMPPALLTASLSSTDFLRNVEDWKTGMATEAGARFRVLRDNDFHLSFGNESAFFGVRDRLLYLTSNSNLADQACLSSSDASLRDLAGKMKGKVFFATLDAPLFLKSLPPLALLLGSGNAFLQMLSSVERLNLSATSSHQFSLEVECNRNLEEIFHH